MNIANIHLLKAIELIGNYNGSTPLNIFLKKYFAQNKKHGSKDRKNISQAIYSYFRMGNSLKHLKVPEAILCSLFLTNDEPEIWEPLYEASWLEIWSKGIEFKIEFLKDKYVEFNSKEIFPLKSFLGNISDKNKFEISHFSQTDVFIRIRPNRREELLKKLVSSNTSFFEESEACIRFSPNIKLQDIIDINFEAVIQDWASQQISTFFNIIKGDFNNQEISLWDCCAASGGKSILAYDIFEKIEICVSDVRISILENLKSRFKSAKIQKFTLHQMDCASENFQFKNGKFDIVLADVPCSGSGTWGRTPESLTFFDSTKIGEFQNLQQKIIRNTIPFVKKNGYYLFITCSVFKMENEENVEFILNKFPNLNLIQSIYFQGYTIKADTLFAALFKLDN